MFIFVLGLVIFPTMSSMFKPIKSSLSHRKLKCLMECYELTSLKEVITGDLLMLIKLSTQMLVYGLETLHEIKIIFLFGFVVGI